MIAIAMYILLGVFVTLLLVLFFTPLIWRRAVRLTEKRMMAEMPLSYNELQAEKDMQRAEQAIDLRRLEITAETRLEDISNKTMKIERLQHTIAEREATIQERDGTIEDRKLDIATLKDELAAQVNETKETHNELTNTLTTLGHARDSISDLETEKAGLEGEIEQLETTLSERKIEIVAQLARIENDKEEIAELTSKLNTETDKRTETESLLNQKTAEFERSKERMERNQNKIDTLQSELADKDIEIDKLNRRLERALSEKPQVDAAAAQRLAEAETRRVEAEAKVASLSLQLDRQQSEPAGDNLSGLVDDLSRDKIQLQNKLDAATEEKENLLDKLREIEKQIAKSKEQEATKLSPSELLLRNEIKNIAARITGFAAESEGHSSPIHALLNPSSDGETLDTSSPTVLNGTDSSEGQTGELATNDASEAPDTPAETDAEPASPKEKQASDPWNQVFSLADRIRKMSDHKEDTAANS